MAPGRTDDGHDKPELPLEPGVTGMKARQERPNFPKPPKFDDKHEEREYLKGRLAAAFRIFGKYGFDEGIAGHITLRVSNKIQQRITAACNKIADQGRTRLSPTHFGSTHSAWPSLSSRDLI